MDNQNRYEDVPQKENPFLKVLKMFLTFLRNLGYDFITSFKYNNMKAAGLLIMVPGLFIGFCLGIHSSVIRYTEYKTGLDSYYMNFKFDYSGIALFVLMLFGILNIFTGVQLMGKKNLGSVIMSSLCTLVIIVAGVLYLYALYVFTKGFHEFRDALNELINQGMSYDDAVEIVDVGISLDGDTMDKIKDSDIYFSFASIIVSMVCPIIGCILGFINYDRTYEKVDR